MPMIDCAATQRIQRAAGSAKALDAIDRQMLAARSMNRAWPSCYLELCVLRLGHRGRHLDRFGGRSGRGSLAQRRAQLEFLAMLPEVR